MQLIQINGNLIPVQEFIKISGISRMIDYQSNNTKAVSYYFFASTRNERFLFEHKDQKTLQKMRSELIHSIFPNSLIIEIEPKAVVSKDA